MTEEKAILLCQKGDMTAFSYLYDEYVKPIYRFIYYKTHHKETTEDLVSITFTKVLEKIESFDGSKASFKTWVYQIARNNVTDHYRTFKQHEDIVDRWDLSTKENISDDTSNKLQIERVEKYLKTLKPEAREILLLRLWGGHSFKEISEMTNKTEASCKMMFKRNIEKIRTDLALLIILINLIA